MASYCGHVLIETRWVTELQYETVVLVGLFICPFPLLSNKTIVNRIYLFSLDRNHFEKY